MVHVSPGVYSTVEEFPTVAGALNTTMLVLIGTASKGDINTLTPTFSQEAFVSAFGAINGQNHGQFTAMQYLKRGTQLYYYRIAAAHASQGSVLIKDSLGASVFTVSTVYKGSYLNGFKVVIGAGTILNTFKFTFRNPDDENGFAGKDIEVFDNCVLSMQGAPQGAGLLQDAILASTNLLLTVHDVSKTPVQKGYVIAMGDDGVAEDMDSLVIGTISGNERTGIKELYNSEKHTFNLVAVPGFVSEVIYQELNNLCESRGDCMFVMDAPFDKNFKLGVGASPVEFGKEGGKATANIGTNELAIKAISGGTGSASLKFVVSDTVTAGNEKITFANGIMTIEIESGVSTVADVLRAAEYPIGVPFVSIMSNSATPEVTFVSTLVETLFSALPSYTAGTVYACPTSTDLVNWHNAVSHMNYDAVLRPWGLNMALNFEYGALYSTYVKYYDSYTASYYWTPTCGHILASYAYNDTIKYPWYAAAGVNRGVLADGVGVQHSPDIGERDLLYGGQNCINSIVNFIDSGLTIWGQKLTKRSGIVTRVNILRCILYARKIISVASRSVLFEPNLPNTWSQLRGLINPVLRGIQAKQGLADFKVVIDETTNTPDIVDQDKIVGKIYLKPARTAEVITYNFFITPTGTNFAEL